MAAKKAVVNGAKKAAGKVAKKTAAKGGKPRKAASKCVDSPRDIFTKVNVFARGMRDWATDDGDIENCYQKVGGCRTGARKKELLRLCNDFATWARAVKELADEIEGCWAAGCKEDGGPNHVAPPQPPF
ncbi:MAG: hypothetical protein ABIT91_16735 [Gemmatimonadaceae bacterium]